MSDLLVIGQRPIDALVAWEERDIGYVAACEGGTDSELVSARLGCPVETVERRIGIRHPWSNANVEDAAALMYAGCNRDTADDLLPYAASSLCEARLRSRSSIFALPHSLKANLDDKVRTRRSLRKLGISTPPSAVVPGADIAFDALRERIGVPFVVQRRAGSAGVGTWIIREPQDVPRVAAAPGEPLLVSLHLAGPVINVHGVVTDTGAVAAPPSVQGHGIAGVGVGDAGYCGNDFRLAGALDECAIAAVVRDTRRAGSWLQSLGYRGVFGVDFVVCDELSYLLEINPRFQGSSWLLAELQAEIGEPRIGDRHLAAFAGGEMPRHAARPLDRGSFVVVHHTGDEPVVVSRELAAGGYAVVDDELVWRRPALSPIDDRGADVVIGGAPRAGVRVLPGSVLARISSTHSLFVSATQLSPLGQVAVDAVRRALCGARPTPATAGVPSVAS